MRLTHIKLSGFKSFTDPTTINVPGQLVAVIGPNGCGKSNVIDAVRWVLGEASAKQLRGESMQDVIFNGAATRRPAPRASVELVFNNADHTLQGLWGQYSEISIKRQLTRQGESTYYINNQVVRRRDITNLFLGTGVGARGYAVIEQGMISRIIEAKPEELRAYIEEAAGVSKYKERRKETEGRLNDTRDHLHRLSDLQSELNRQVEKLQKQATTAEHYQTLRTELAEKQNLLDYTQWQLALQAADRATEQYDTLIAQQNTLNNGATSINETIQALQQQEQAAQAEALEINNRRSVLREELARLEEQIRSRQNLHQRLERERTAAQVELQKIAQQQQSLQTEHHTLDQHIETKQAELAELALQVAEYEERLPELEERFSEAESAHQSQQDEYNRLQRELALKKQQHQHQQQTLQQNTQRRQLLTTEQTALNLPNSAETEAAQTEAAEFLAIQNEYEQQLANAENELQQQRQHVQTTAKHADTLKHQYITLEAQYNALNELLQQTNSADFWQQQPERNTPQLWQHISVPNEWQHALSIVLDTRLQAHLVAPNFTPPTPLPEGHAAWILPSSAPKKSQPAQALINQIQADPRFQAALDYWLDGILCAPSLEYALAHRNDLPAKHLWLTPEGHQIDHAGVVLHSQNNQENLITRQSRLKEWQDTLNLLKPQLETAQTAHQHATQALENHQASTLQLQQQVRSHQQHTQAAQARATELLTRTNQGQLRQDAINRELIELEITIETLHHTSDGLEDDIAALQEAVITLEESKTHSEQVRQHQQSAIKQARLQLLDANRRYGLAEVETHKLQQKQHSITERIATLEQQALDWQERQAELALAYETETLDDEQHIKLETLGEQITALDDAYQAAQGRLNHLQQQSKQQYQEQQNIAARLPQIQAAAQTALLQQQEALINAKRYHDNLSSRDADLDTIETQAQQNHTSPENLNQRINELALQIQALGPVNLAALQELEEVRERDDYYRNQREDVQTAINRLEDAIAQIDQETKARFKETFDAVNEKVQTFFPTLFGGGEATLHMVGDDLLSAGVSIMARPPGKKNSTIHLLSGGEKALTAMSLVFALFSLNPAPFCLLDEVDAPLDDANTARFCNLVKEMSSQTQFLYISHNRLTMEMAEQLVGVTMQEKGVSRIVSVDIQTALNMAENSVHSV